MLFVGFRLPSYSVILKSLASVVGPSDFILPYEPLIVNEGPVLYVTENLSKTRPKVSYSPPLGIVNFNLLICFLVEAAEFRDRSSPQDSQ